MAHALHKYQGPCKNIHGHTYHFSVTLIGLPKQEEGCSKDGMVTDFGNIKRIVQEAVIDKFDHALLLNHKSPLSNSKDIRDECEKLVVLPFQPTCENLLIYFVSLVRKKFTSGQELISERLDETTNSYAEWFLLDNQD
ncbi:MAG: 6-carboxytetrahydropterin synthase [Saprospiraceae bacterium]|nr:6-carboxytetrahydropterin synthase [Saprospiraceae bacterium]